MFWSNPSVYNQYKWRSAPNLVLWEVPVKSSAPFPQVFLQLILNPLIIALVAMSLFYQITCALSDLNRSPLSDGLLKLNIFILERNSIAYIQREYAQQ